MSTVISAKTRVLGALHSDEDVVVHGIVEGGVQSLGAVTLSPTGRIEGDVHAREIVVAGVHRHNLIATGTVRLLSTASVFGDVAAPQISVDEGAALEGRVRIRRQSLAAGDGVAPPLASAPTPAFKTAAQPALLASATVVDAPPTSSAPSPRADRTIPELPTLGRRSATRRQG